MEVEKEGAIIGFEWGRTSKGDPIARPHNIVGAIRNGNIPSERIKNIEECGEAKIILTTDGNIFTGGSNENGIIGIPEISLKDFTSTLNQLEVAGKTFEEISAGRKHILALTKDGLVYAWGNNTFGQVGKNVPLVGPKKDGNPSPQKVDPESPSKDSNISRIKVVNVPTLIQFDRTIIQILAIDTSSYALDSSGVVWSWGREQYIGRASGEILEKNEDGKPVRVAANHIPKQVRILDNQGKDLKVRALLKKGKKIVTLLGGTGIKKEESEQKEEKKSEIIMEPLASEPSAERESKKVSIPIVQKKKRTAEQELNDYSLLKEMSKKCNSNILEQLILFENGLQLKVGDYKNFTENPFGNVLKGNDSKINQSGEKEEKMNPKPVHIELKTGLKKLEQIYNEFTNLRDLFKPPAKKAEENEEDKEKREFEISDIIEFIVKLLEDSIRLRKLSLLAFKLHSYHLRLKNRNVLSLAATTLSGEKGSAPLSKLVKKMDDILCECEYVCRRFGKLNGEFNKIYDDKISAVTSRTAYHMIDTVYSECQAWKYVNLVGEYAMLYQAGYEDLLSVSEKMEKLHGMYNDLKKGDAHRILEAYESAVEIDQQRKLIEEGKAQIISANEIIVAAKNEICVDGHGSDSVHKKILMQAYEMLVDLSLLRLANYEQFASLYDSLGKAAQNSAQK